VINLKCKNLKGLLQLILVVLFFCSCSKKLYFAASTIAPAAEGVVKYKKDANTNYCVDLKILNLADSRRLDPPKNYYVLWMTTEQNGVKNLGQVRSLKDVYTGALRARLKTVTAFKPTGFYITGEDQANISSPGSQIVLRTR
jgi:hypothetical protein